MLNHSNSSLYTNFMVFYATQKPDSFFEFCTSGSNHMGLHLRTEAEAISKLWSLEWCDRRWTKYGVRRTF